MNDRGAKEKNSGLDAAGSFSSVNQHCLESIVDLSEQMEVIAAHDICDESGRKLWAKGHPVSRGLQEKLLRRRLSRPLEASLSVAGGATLETSVADCWNLMEENRALGLLAGSSDARGLLRSVQTLALPGPVKLLLTSARERKRKNYVHSLATMLICAGVASRLELNEHDAARLILAALVHDIGEMYINPAYLDGSKPLAPAEWKYVASHPCVGQAFIREFTSFPAVVADCVLHHHERLDGSGYPFQVSATGMGRLGALLAVADSVSAIVIRGDCGVRERVSVALHIAPGEFDRQAVSAVSEMLRALGNSTCESGETGCLLRVVPALQRVETARKAAEALVARAPSQRAADSGRYVLAALGNINKSLRATGVFDVSQLAAIENDPAIMAEVCLVIGEVSWRLRNLARNVYLRTEHGDDDVELDHVADLVAALDGPQAEGIPAAA